MKAKHIAITAVFMIIIFGLSLFFILSPSQKYSLSERRALAGKPDLTLETISGGSFMTDFEAYTLDQFPARDTFRRAKALSSKYLFAKKDNNALYSERGYLSRLEYPLDKARVNSNADKLFGIFRNHLSDTDCRLYLCVIPDKNCFLAPKGRYPYIEPSDIEEIMKSRLEDAKYIDIGDLLQLEDFYFTDQHWRQEKITDIAKRLNEAMDAPFSDSFNENTLDVPFYGTYAGQSALPVKPEEIKYLTGGCIPSLKVTSYASGKAQEGSVYDMKKAHGKDAYEMFLGGSDPLVEIENPLCENGKELIIFRDSFSSSLAPLMASGYSKITLVDLRYIKSDLIGNYITFDDQDILFLYSTLILNGSISL